MILRLHSNIKLLIFLIQLYCLIKSSTSNLFILHQQQAQPFILHNISKTSHLVLNSKHQQESQYSQTTNNRKLVRDSSNLMLEYCNDCDLFLGGLFPVHAPKYMRQTVSNMIRQQQQQQITTTPSLTNVIENEQSFTFSQAIDLKNFISTTSASVYGTSVDMKDYDDYFLNGISCGEIKKERGIQRLEAMLYAIDLINNSTTLLPNIKLGARIFDSCDRDTIALEKCVNFIGDYYLLNNENIANDFSCESTLNENNRFYSINKNGAHNSHFTPRKKNEAIYKRKVVGVIGSASSSVSIQVANLLRLFQVPQISYASTSPELSNKERFPFFSRVLPSDKLQAEAMASLVYHLDWNYVATLGEEGNLGGIDAFISYAKAKKICIAGSYTISQTASEEYVKNILNDMYKAKNARGVVMFLQDHNIRKLLEIVSNLNMTGHFLWVASDSWGTKKESINTNDLVAEGAITFLPKSYEIKEFNDYFKKLKPKTNKRNPWFNEFWEEQFNCTMDHAVSYSHQPRLSKRLCTGEENLNFTQDGFIHFVIDSVFSMAHAIQNLMNLHCGVADLNKTQLFECQHKVALKGPELLKAIRNVEFISITGRPVKFIKEKENVGDGLAPFEVFQYQQYEPGKFGYTKLTEWEKDKPFKLDKTRLKWNLDQNNFKLPRSVCKEECALGEIKQGDDCCWVCVRCEENEYVAPNRKECIRCAQGYGPNITKTACVKLDIEYMVFSSPFTIIPIIFSSIGILFTCYVIFVFIRYNSTPIIKASGRELCFVLLAGIMSCYLITFPLVTKPSTFSCVMLRFGVSLSLTICLSALFTKTNRLSRIFNNSIKQVRQASYVSPTSQLVICFSIIGVQIVGILIWIVISPPNIDYDYDDPKRVILQCKTQNTHFAISQAYNMFLVALCTIYAIKTRKIPENFNEARFIGFTMYSICIIWSAFIPIYFGTTAAAGTSKSPKNNYKIQLTTMAMCLSLSATVIQFCLFLPKLNVVLLKPDKNVRLKSGAIVKSVYQTHQKSVLLKDQQKHTNLTSLSPLTAALNTVVIAEKSLTLGTGVSTPSSPHPNTYNKKSIFSVASNNDSKILASSSQVDENSTSNETNHQMNVTDNKLIVLTVKKETSFITEQAPTIASADANNNNSNTAENKPINIDEIKIVKEVEEEKVVVKADVEEKQVTANTNEDDFKDELLEEYKKLNANFFKSLENEIETDIVSIDNTDENVEYMTSDEQNTCKLIENSLNDNNKEFKAIRIGFSRGASEENTKASSPTEYYYLIRPNQSANKSDSYQMQSFEPNLLNKDYVAASSLEEEENEVAGEEDDENDEGFDLIYHEPAAGSSKPNHDLNYKYIVRNQFKDNNNGSINNTSHLKFNETSMNSASSFKKLTYNTSNPAIITYASSSSSNTNGNVADMNEKAIKKVLEKCFDQISRTNKLSSPCIYVKNREKTQSNHIVNSSSHHQKLKLNDHNNNHKSATNYFMNNYDYSANGNSNAIVTSSNNATNDYSSSSILTSTSSSIENLKIKETVVEKAIDILNAPTNTLLLSGTNETNNELYSLKITFV